MFLKKLKDNNANRVLKKCISNRKDGSLQDRGKTVSLGCIVNIDEFNHTEVFTALYKEMGLRENQFKIIGFTSREESFSGFSIPVFTVKDLGWGGVIKNQGVLEFMNWEYDVLLSYYEEAPIVLKLVTAQTVANLKTGLLVKNQELNDVVFEIKPDKFSQFRSEFLKYLTIVKKV
ncbi:DUF6913 domain-containing protein [Ascidiimonas aurantiaca]|uniref:DUF6913 domain-containing protein n=1 Tax=Ascidiimonas aurantiaca TaxID=1685432 RepID=UPI0030ED6165